MLDLIQRLRSRPLHLRRRVALMASGGVTAVVALAWVTASVATGAFSSAPPQHDSIVADLGNTFAATKAQTASVLSGTAGPASATSSAAASAPATSGGLTIVETKDTSSLAQVDPSTRTIIPF